MNQILETFHSYMSNHTTFFETIGQNALKIILIVVMVQVLISILCRLSSRLLHFHQKISDRRRNTLESLFHNIIKYTLYFILIMTILPILGVHIAALLAGAGVAGIAIAFGAQSLLKDFFNGIFISFEDQYDVGDYVTINGNWGEIRNLGLRVTQIKVWTGEIITIPNGQVNQVTNYSKENSIAVIDVDIGYKTDTDEALEIVQEVMAGLKENDENIVGDVDILGVQALNHSTYKIRAIAECNPYTHFGVIRSAKKTLRKVFSERHVDLPSQKVVYMYEQPAQEPGPHN